MQAGELPINEPDLARWRACARRFWLQRHRPAGPPSPSPPLRPSDDRTVQGPGAAQALQAHHPRLVRLPAPVTAAEWRQAIDATDRHLVSLASQEEGWALEGACLASDDGVRVRIDLLTRGSAGWRLFRLRHATAGTEADVDTVALWLHVAARNVLRIQSAGLMLVDTAFVYPGHGCYAGLYREVDLGPVLGARPVAQWIVEMRRCLQGAQPAIPLGAPCGVAAAPAGACEALERCGLPLAKVRVADPSASLDLVGRELAAALRAEGHADLHTVPLQRLASARQRRTARAVQLGHAVLDAGATEALGRIPGPRRWLRFETIGFAVPPWPGTHPYQALPFQWSCDAEDGAGGVAHRGFLADAQADPRRAFAQSLLQGLGGEGALLAYNAGFERNRIRELAQRFEDLRPALLALLPRIVDLFALLREHWYHPALAGSWSLRSVFSVVAPDLGAHAFEFEWRGGVLRSPLQAYAAALRSDLSAPEAQALQAALRAHGERHCAALRRVTALLEG